MNTRTIEPRKSTPEPLVEIAILADGADGSNVPSGRRFSAVPHSDGRNSFGLTELENIAFAEAEDRLAGRSDQHYSDSALDAALVAAGLGAGANDAARQAFVADYRAKNPLPMSFATLPDGDPCSNYKPIALGTPLPRAPLVVSGAPASTITHVDELTSAHPLVTTTVGPNGAPSEFGVRAGDTVTHAAVPVAHVNFLRGLLEAIEPSAEAAVQQLALSAFQAAFRKVFPKAA